LKELAAVQTGTEDEMTVEEGAGLPEQVEQFEAHPLSRSSAQIVCETL
jgi:hypothetical protein